MTWVAGPATNGLVWVDTILLGIFGSSAEVGLYNVAARLTALAAFVMLPIMSSFGPRIADLSQRADHHTLERIYAWSLVRALPSDPRAHAVPRDGP